MFRPDSEQWRLARALAPPDGQELDQEELVQAALLAVRWVEALVETEAVAERAERLSPRPTLAPRSGGQTTQNCTHNLGV